MEKMAAIEGVGCLDHRSRLPENHGEFVNVTVPYQIKEARQRGAIMARRRLLRLAAAITSPAGRLRGLHHELF
jgi:hypothetical protein